MRLHFLLIFFIWHVFSYAQEIPASLLTAIKGKELSEQARLLDSAAGHYRNDDIRLSVKIARYNLLFCKKNDLKKGAVKSYLNLCRTYRGTGAYDTSLLYIDSAKTFAFANNVHQQYGNIYDYEGLVYMRMSDYKRATESFYKSISYSEKEKDSIKIHDAFGHLGVVAFYRTDYKTAIGFYKKSLSFIPKDADLISHITVIDNIGLCYSNLNMLDSAFYFQKQAVDAIEKTNDSTLLAEAYSNIGSTLLLLKDYDQAAPYINKAVAINDALNNDYGKIISNLYKGRLYIETKKYKEAIPPLEKAFDLGEKMKLPEQTKEVAASLAEAYEGIGDYKQANIYQRKLATIIMEISKEENIKAINELSAQYETEKKQQQIQLLTKDTELQQQTIQNDRYIKITIGIVAIMLLIISILFIYRFREKKKDNQLLQEKNNAIALQKNQIEKQKEELFHKNTEITDSINYARRIQSSVIPSAEFVKQLLPDSFIYFNPKDIVSGDFYWLAEKNNLIYFAVADCTGHGVPGAMMSMLGTSLLNQIISEEKIKYPAEILKELHYHVVRSLNENIEKRDSKDGMDIALIAIDPHNHKLFFAGAGRPLYFMQNNELHIIKADKYSIGGIFDAHSIQFQHHEISFDNQIAVYLFSDGPPDQFGGPKGKKFMTRQIQELVIQMHRLSVQEQERIFTETFENWKGSIEQTDDVTFAGILLS